MGLASALNWYQKKIGAYDKQSWEKTVDQRILRGVCAVPKKTARIKTELIDVDLVRGSAFPKAKPQHSWIAATSSGVIRVLFLPFYFTWWQQQTNSLVSSILIALYFLQMVAMYLYFSAEEADFPDVPASEILTPAAMMLVLGIVHSQIVATFSIKTSHKRVTRTKRKRVKRKSRTKTSFADYESKSSPETASEDKPDGIQIYQRPASYENPDESPIKSAVNHQSSSSFQINPRSHCHLPQRSNAFSDSSNACTCPHGANDVAEMKKKNSDDESGLDSLDFTQPTEDNVGKLNLLSNIKCKVHHDSGCILENDTIGTASTSYCINSKNQKLYFSQEDQCGPRSSFAATDLKTRKPPGPLREDSVDTGNVSSGEEYFIAKKPSYNQEQWKEYLCRRSSSNFLSSHMTNNGCIKPDCRKTCQRCFMRRFSDLGPRNYLYLTNEQLAELQQADRRFSEDGLLSHSPDFCESHNQEHIPVARNVTGDINDHLKVSGGNIRGVWGYMKKRRHIPVLRLPLNVERGCYSSCESGADTTSPNTPTKPQTSDLEWPIITNTDCNSDSSDCSSQCSQEDRSDITPSENPFAWEMQETPTTLFSGSYTGSDKGTRSGTVSCTIWEQNECKKVDLTVLDISSAIIHKVDSSVQSTEYLAIGLIFATIVSFLPLLFRLQTGTAKDAIQDVTSDVLLLTVPSTHDVARITEVLQEVMLGSTWRVKVTVLIVMLERFALSLSYFFLLSVAERTFKQRFLYAKHFCHLTSSRRARRSDLPHFRLNKVRNIKTWLSVRSYLKKHGPQRSVDVIVSIAFILEVCVLSFLCVQLLKETEHFADRLYCWETLCWNLAVGLFLMRFMILGSKINKKYRNLSVLITEQINLYLHMEQKPHKKEELMLANSVLKLAADLLKELESPFKISGLCANPYLYNITKVVVLSAFSAVLTELLGFKLKLYKIKIK